MSGEVHRCVVAAGTRTAAALGLGLAASLAACGDGPLEPEEGFFASAGVVMVSEGEELLRYRDADGASVPALRLVEDAVHRDVEIFFLDEEETPIGEDPGDAFDSDPLELEVQVTQESIALWETGSRTGAVFTGTLTARRVGNTSLEIRLRVGERLAYESPQFPVNVREREDAENVGNAATGIPGERSSPGLY